MPVLWVGQFLNVVTYQEIDEKASQTLAGCLYEGMDAHRFAAEVRLANMKK